MELIVQLLLSMAFSAFFSGMEIAFVSSNKLRFEMAKGNNLSTKLLSVFYANPNNFISTMLVGNNIALVIYGILMTKLIEQSILIRFVTNPALLVVIETIISTLIILVTGEFMPKTFFKINPNLTLKIFSLPTFIFYILLYPISRFASLVSTAILRLTGTRISEDDTDKAFTKVDLDYFIQSSLRDAGNEDNVDTEIKIFQNALDFSSIKVRDCMIPRTEIIGVEVDDSIETLRETFIENGISKVLIYKEDIDHIIGYIHSSDLFKNSKDLRKNIRTIPIVPETMSGQKLMQLFMQEKRSIAVVVDEFGGTSGIVTMEDLVEEIFGDIEDEHDTKSIVAKQVGDDEYIFSGRLYIEKANELFGLDLPEKDDYQTIGGYILHEYQSFPKPNEIITVDKYQFKIIRGTATKIELVRLKVFY